MTPTNDIDLWFRYEEIAMHFNNLLMQFRLQLMGGIGALGTLAGYLIGEKMEAGVRRDQLIFFASAGLTVLVAAAASLDLFYYDRLLRGAVAALIDFEAKHPTIQMSTTIEGVVGRGKDVAWYVYGAVVGLLIVFSGWSAVRYRRRARAARQQESARTRIGRSHSR